MKVTNMAAFRAARNKPINDACRWSEAGETVWLANWRAAFAMHRNWLRF